MRSEKSLQSSVKIPEMTIRSVWILLYQNLVSLISELFTTFWLDFSQCLWLGSYQNFGKLAKRFALGAKFCSVFSEAGKPSAYYCALPFFVCVHKSQKITMVSMKLTKVGKYLGRWLIGVSALSMLPSTPAIKLFAFGLI